jgi:putative membrane protein
MHPFYPGFQDGLWWVHDLIWAIVVIALAAGVFIVVRGLTLRSGVHRQGHWGYWLGGPPPQSQALTELDLRYARGEVDRAEYLQRRADLLGHPAGVDPRHTPGPTPGP